MKKIIEDIIREFEAEKFIKFFRDKNRAFSPRREEFIDDGDFSDGKKLGEIKFSDGKLIVASLRVKNSLSERSGKKAQYEIGKKILKNFQMDAGIFIFYDERGNFRFSLIYANYLGQKREWSMFRRFTYFVSAELTNKTFRDRIGDGDFSSLEKIKEAFSVEKVTKEFYEDIANWYFWAVEHCVFPKDAEAEENGRNISIIRLITRIIFIWFMRERGLIPRKLFNESDISKIIKDLSPENSSYYHTILQNLFFATLSTKKEERKFRSEIRGNKGYNSDFGNQSVFRFQEFFNNPEKIKDYFGEIPFLNGGLFECLDDKLNGIYIDGFTSVKKNQPNVPNFLFFGNEQKVDLNSAYGTKDKKYKVRGLLEILSSFNFTIDENSPDDADVALDPELLGRVFENLLASFNPETSTTARKATGSYYTPREIVDYMVAESLKAYFKTHLIDHCHSDRSESRSMRQSGAEESLDNKLNMLFSVSTYENYFDKAESKKIVELIESVRIVDPAVGSGAFPMGALNKLVFILTKVDPENELWKQAQISAADKIPDRNLRDKTKKDIEIYFKSKQPDYWRKLYLIQRCIYGVDIQQIAVEITKLRFFISLLVDEDINNIQPLPNLDFKIMQGNSLLEEYEGVKLFDEKLLAKNNFNKQKQIDLIKESQLKLQREYLSLHSKNKLTIIKQTELNNELKKLEKGLKILNMDARKDDYNIGLFDAQNEAKQKREILKNLHKEFFETNDKKEKDKIRDRIREMEWDLIEATLKEQNKISELKRLEKFKKSNTKPFFLWKLYFADVFEKGGFDIVIGNPPYIKEYTKRAVFDGLRTSPYYQGKMDLWYFFGCIGLDLLKFGGIESYIAPNNWITNAGASKFRNKVLDSARILNFIDFGNFKIFECAGIQTMVYLLKKEKEENSYNLRYAKIINDNIGRNELSGFLQSEFDVKNDKFIKQIIKINNDKFRNGNIVFLDNGLKEIFEKIKLRDSFYLTEGEVANGIHPHYDYVSKASQQILGNKYKVGDGIFVLSEIEKSNLSLAKNELEIIKPYYTTKQIHKWYGKIKNKEWIIYTDSKFKNPQNIAPYPSIKKHLDQFKKVITSSNKPYGLHRAREERFFKGEKIIIARKCVEPQFCYTDFDCYVSATFYVIKTDKVSLKFLTALLNSKLIKFWLKHQGKMQGDNYQLDKDPLLKIPLIDIPQSGQKPFIDLVDKILAITKSDDYFKNSEKQAEVKKYERHIDEMVYALYGLGEGEREVVDGRA